MNLFNELQMVKARYINRKVNLDADNNITNNEEESENKSNPSYGNTKLPFGLCKKFGIDIDEKWKPRDAWNALKEKTGLSHDEVLAKVQEEGTADDVEEMTDVEPVEEKYEDIGGPDKKLFEDMSKKIAYNGDIKGTVKDTCDMLQENSLFSFQDKDGKRRIFRKTLIGYDNEYAFLEIENKKAKSLVSDKIVKSLISESLGDNPKTEFNIYSSNGFDFSVPEYTFDNNYTNELFTFIYDYGDGEEGIKEFIKSKMIDKKFGKGSKFKYIDDTGEMAFELIEKGLYLMTFNGDKANYCTVDEMAISISASISSMETILDTTDDEELSKWMQFDIKLEDGGLSGSEARSIDNPSHLGVTSVDSSKTERIKLDGYGTEYDTEVSDNFMDTFEEELGENWQEILESSDEEYKEEKKECFNSFLSSMNDNESIEFKTEYNDEYKIIKNRNKVCIINDDLDYIEKEYFDDYFFDEIPIDDASEILSELGINPYTVKSKVGVDYGYRCSTTFDDEAYSDKRKDDAVWIKYSEYDNDESSVVERSREFAYDHQGNIFEQFGDFDLSVIKRYTGGCNTFNKALRGNSYSISDAVLINSLSESIEDSMFKTDIWVQRGVSVDGAEKFFGKSIDELESGDEGHDDAFLSTGLAKNTGFDDEKVILNLYCPRGTKGLYVEDNTLYDGENEVILQRGTSVRATKIEKSGGKYYIDVEVISQEYETINPLDI